MIISLATSQDYEKIFELQKSLAQLHYENASWNFENNFDGYFSKSEFENMLKNEDYIILVAKENNVVVGHLISKILESMDLKILKKRTWLQISDVVVDEKFRKKGVGKFLMSEVEKLAKEKNISSLELGVYSFNKNAKNFYENLGFEEFIVKMRKEI